MVLKEPILYMNRDSLPFAAVSLTFIHLGTKSLTGWNYSEMKWIPSGYLIRSHSLVKGAWPRYRSSQILKLISLKKKKFLFFSFFLKIRSSGCTTTGL